MQKLMAAALFSICFAIALAAGNFAAAQSYDLRFRPDVGARVDPGYLPKPYIDAYGTTHLWYESDGMGRLYATSADGLTFTSATYPATYENFPLRVLLPYPDSAGAPIWRIYEMDIDAFELDSLSSNDGAYFTPDAGIRYSPGPDDGGYIGVYDIFTDSSGGVAMLYVADKDGLNNTRRAYSTDNGDTFIYDSATGVNLLGDATAGGGPNSHVDIKSILLPDGSRRLFTMTNGGQEIHSFISYDEGRTFASEGVRVRASDFPVYSLHDPFVVDLADGRYRMYVAGRVTDYPEGSANEYVIVSATTPPPPSLIGLPFDCIGKPTDCFVFMGGPERAFPPDTRLRPLPNFDPIEFGILWIPLPIPEEIWRNVRILSEVFTFESPVRFLEKPAMLSVKVDPELAAGLYVDIYRLAGERWEPMGSRQIGDRIVAGVQDLSARYAVFGLQPPPQDGNGQMAPHEGALRIAPDGF